MKIKVFQIDMDRDKSHIKFMGYDTLEKYQGSKDIDASLYEEVYAGELEIEHVEDVYTLFNTETVPLHRGHSVSVSDIVETEDGFFYCDRIGFKKVDFDPSLTTKPEDLLRVIYVKPGCRAFEAEMERGLEPIQRAVRGTYEQVYMDDDTIILCNDEAKLMGMPGNRRYNNGESVIAGPFVIVRGGDEDYESLTDEQVEKYMARFGEPEEISMEETLADMGFTIYTLG